MVTDLGQGIYTLVQGTYFGELELLEPVKKLLLTFSLTKSLLSQRGYALHRQVNHQLLLSAIKLYSWRH